MTTTTFVFLRHGQATHNVAALIEGNSAYYSPEHTDAALTPKGSEQADDARSRLAEAGPFDAIFCSPLRRCRQTLLGAMPSSRHINVKLDDRLMEPQGVECNRRTSRGLIVFDVPKKWDLRKVEHDNVWERWSKEAGTPTTSPHFPNRVRHFTDEVVRFWPGKRVLIVGHWEWIHTWMRTYKGVDTDIPNCGIFEVELTAAEHAAHKIDWAKPIYVGDTNGAPPECHNV